MDDVESSNGNNCIPLSLWNKGILSLHLSCEGPKGMTYLGGVSNGTNIDSGNNKGHGSG